MSESLAPWLAPLLLPEELRASDAHAIDGCGIPGITLMERAGAALAQRAMRLLPAGPMVVICGPGNNGGDGFVAARLLHEQGRPVHIVATRPGHTSRGDAALALAALPAELRPAAVDRLPGLLHGAAGAIDAVLGTGATGAPAGEEERAIRALAAADLPIIACDVASGVDAATGEIAGAVAPAIATVTFHRASPGHVIHPGKAATGRLEVVDIGIPGGAPIAPRSGVIRGRAITPLPGRSAQSHKYTAGHVLVVAGSTAYPGAAVLTVRGAQRGGAGYVTALLPPVAASLVHRAAPEAVVLDADGTRDPGAVATVAGRAQAAVIGPGLAEPRAVPVAEQLLRAPIPVVLDADGLALLSRSGPEELRRNAPLILTPHAGELARILDRSSADVQATRLGCARDLARRTGAIIVLKGDDTLIVAPDGRLAVNDLPSPALATAGTGDVLAGLMGALLAAGADPWLAACAAVRLHAQAGRVAARRAGSVDGVVALDVAEALPAARGGAVA